MLVSQTASPLAGLRQMIAPQPHAEPEAAPAPARTEVPAAAPAAPAAPAAQSSAWTRGAVHPMWMAPPALGINASLSGMIDTVKNTFLKLRMKPDDLAAAQVKAAVEMMQADQAAQGQGAVDGAAAVTG
ncbi:MAG: hypothetical protein JWN72_34 [Thermoleophilia bacterium]|nr:hypothetical protein [Thermoleophilia bacterium]